MYHWLLGKENNSFKKEIFKEKNKAIKEYGPGCNKNNCSFFKHGVHEYNCTNLYGDPYSQNYYEQVNIWGSCDSFYNITGDKNLAYQAMVQCTQNNVELILMKLKIALQVKIV